MSQFMNPNAPSQPECHAAAHQQGSDDVNAPKQKPIPDDVRTEGEPAEHPSHVPDASSPNEASIADRQPARPVLGVEQHRAFRPEHPLKHQRPAAKSIEDVRREQEQQRQAAKQLNQPVQDAAQPAPSGPVGGTAAQQAIGEGALLPTGTGRISEAAELDDTDNIEDEGPEQRDAFRPEHPLKHQRPVTKPEVRSGPEVEVIEAVESTSLGRSWWRDGRIIALVLLLGTVVLLTMLAQAVLLLNQLALMPPYARILGYTGVGLLTLIAVGAIGRLAWVFVHLRTTPNVSLTALEEVRRRAEMRQQAAEDTLAAVGRVAEFLRGYDASSPKMRKRLERLRVEPATVNKLGQRRRQLLERDYTDSNSWLRDVSDHFLGPLDVAARERIRLYAIAAGIKTAALPSGLLDTLAVLSNAYLMIADLCELYNVKTSRTGTLGLLVHVCLLSLVAANLEDVADSAIDTSVDAFTQDLTALGAGIVGGMTNLTKRGAQGLINYALVKRLGRTAIRELRPIADPQAEKRGTLVGCHGRLRGLLFGD
jgi:uncharacterized membrane protein YcjF (UPF0283 family)